MSLLSLQSYGEWYYTRYFPSICVLREKILQKSHDSISTEQVMINLQPLFVEKNIVESRTREYIGKGKTEYYIRQKLVQKKFDISVIEEVLNEQGEEISDPETYRKVIEVKCQKATKKGFSKKRILYELLGQYPQAREVIQEELESYNDVEILRHIVIPHFLETHSQEKIIQKCIQAGFSARDAQLILKETV